MFESKLVHLFSSSITQCCSLRIEEAVGVVELKSVDQEAIHLCVERELKALLTMESLFSAWFLFITELLSFTSFSGSRKLIPILVKGQMLFLSYALFLTPRL